MKKFNYRFTKLTLIFIYIGIALCVVGMGINVLTIATSDIASEANPVYRIIQYVLMFLIPVVLLIILISLLTSSYYAIDGKTLKKSFGIKKSKYDIGKIETVLLDRTTNKLSVYFNDKVFIVIVVKEDWYDEFIDALCSANRNIEFSINSKEKPDDDENKTK